MQRLRRIGEGGFRSSCSASIPRSSGVAGCGDSACLCSRDDVGVPFTIPTAWHARLWQELTNARGKLEGRQLEVLGKAALHTNQKELAYTASAAGLELGGDQEARFLLLRARALPEWEFERREDCIAADCRARAAPARYVHQSTRRWSYGGPPQRHEQVFRLVRFQIGTTSP